MKILYWAPILSNIATLKAVVNSAESLMRYSNKYNVTLLNSAGEFNDFKNDNIKSNIHDLNCFFFLEIIRLANSFFLD